MKLSKFTKSTLFGFSIICATSAISLSSCGFTWGDHDDDDEVVSPPKRTYDYIMPFLTFGSYRSKVDEYMQTKDVGSVERFYSGTANIDLWIQMSDRSLEPYIMQGDFIGFKAYPKSVYNIFQGDVYAIDTRFDGLKIRVIKNGDNPDTLLACSYNKQDYPDQVIRKEDIIRVYKKVLMFRY